MTIDKEWLHSIGELFTAFLLPLLIYFVKTTSKESSSKLQAVLIAEINSIKLNIGERFGHITTDLALLQNQRKTDVKRISVLETRVNRLQLSNIRMRSKLYEDNKPVQN